MIHARKARALVPALALGRHARVRRDRRGAAGEVLGRGPAVDAQRRTVPAPRPAVASKARASRSIGPRCSRRRGAPIEWGGAGRDRRTGCARRHRRAAHRHRCAELGGEERSRARWRRVARRPRACRSRGRPPRAGRACSRRRSNATGPNGEFWATHPSVPVRPIRTWQIWNEPNFKYFVAKPNPTEYGKLVKLSYSAIRSPIPEPRSSSPGSSRSRRARGRRSGKHTSLNWFASDFLEQMYRTTPGVKASFSGVALHPYTSTWQHLRPGDRRSPRVLRANRDAGKGLWITELGWSSEPAGRGDAFAKGPAGQATELKGAFTLLRTTSASGASSRSTGSRSTTLPGSATSAAVRGCSAPASRRSRPGAPTSSSPAALPNSTVDGLKRDS